MDIKKLIIIVLIISIISFGFICLNSKNFFEPFQTQKLLFEDQGEPISFTLWSEIYDMCANDNYLIIGTSSEIRIYKIGEYDTPYHIINSLSDNEIVRLIILPDDTFIVAFLDNTVYKYNINGSISFFKTFSDIDIVTNMSYDDNTKSVVLSCNKNTVKLLDASLNQKQSFVIYNESTLDDFISDTILVDNKLYICNKYTLTIKDSSNYMFLKTHERTSSVVSHNNDIYVGSLDGNILKVDNNSLVRFKYIGNPIKRMITFDNFLVVSTYKNDYETHVIDFKDPDNINTFTGFGSNLTKLNNKTFIIGNKNNKIKFETLTTVSDPSTKTSSATSTNTSTATDITSTSSKSITLPVFPTYSPVIDKSPTNQTIISIPTTTTSPPPPPVTLPVINIPSTQASQLNIPLKYRTLKVDNISNSDPIIYYNLVNINTWESKDKNISLKYDDDRWKLSINQDIYVFHQIHASIEDLIDKKMWFDTNSKQQSIKIIFPDVDPCSTDSCIEKMKLGKLTIY